MEKREYETIYTLNIKFTCLVKVQFTNWAKSGSQKKRKKNRKKENQVECPSYNVLRTSISHYH